MMGGLFWPSILSLVGISVVFEFCHTLFEGRQEKGRDTERSNVREVGSSRVLKEGTKRGQGSKGERRTTGEHRGKEDSRYGDREKDRRDSGRGESLRERGRKRRQQTPAYVPFLKNVVNS